MPCISIVAPRLTCRLALVCIFSTAYLITCRPRDRDDREEQRELQRYTKPSRHNNWQHEHDEEHTYVAHEHPGVHLECPHGYHHVPGDIGGGDAYGRELNNHMPTIGACKEDCDMREDCLSFEYSPSAEQCYLNKKHLPTEDSVPWKDFLFCSRDLIHITETEVGHDGLDMEDDAVWEEVQKYNKLRKQLLRKQAKLKKNTELSDIECDIQIRELEREIEDLDRQHEEFRENYSGRQASTTTTTPPPLKRRQLPPPKLISLEEAQQRKVQDRINWKRTAKRRQHQEDLRARREAHEKHYGRRHERKRRDIDDGVQVIRPEGPFNDGPDDFWDKELHEVLGKVHRFKVRVSRADFTQEEKDTLYEELELYRQDEHQRIEDAIEAEQMERGSRYGRGYGYDFDDFDDMDYGRHPRLPGRGGRGGRHRRGRRRDDDDDRPWRGGRRGRDRDDEDDLPRGMVLRTKDYRAWGNILKAKQTFLDNRIKEREGKVPDPDEEL